MSVPGDPTDPNDPSTAGVEAPDFQLRLGLAAYTFDVGGFSGNSVALSSSADWNFSPTVGLTLGSFLAYNTTDSADVYHVGIFLGVPLRCRNPTQHWTWRLTPAWRRSRGLGGAGRGRWSTLPAPARWEATPRLALELSNQVGYLHGKALEFGDFKFDPGLKQWILKNGVEAQYMFGESGWYAYGGGSFTSFLDAAAIKGYTSPSVGVGWRKSPHGTTVEFGFLGDFGEGWNGYGVRAAVNIAF
jgi:hypothetical protein